jgi:pimeloyl-ACP methyl ester carboxylesterase
MKIKRNEQQNDLTIGLAQPAQRALASASIQSLEQLTKFTEAEIKQLHGIGPNALKKLHQALATQGLSFADDKPSNTTKNDDAQSATGKYVSVGDLKMYYEVRGRGEPLVMLHGGMLQGGVFYAIAPMLAENRQVITVDQQGHGRTADIDRPLRFEQMADDTAALLDQAGVKKADFFGYSEGGVVALLLAIRHPRLVRKLVLGSAVFNMDGYHPPVQSGMRHMTAKIIPKQMREHYEAVAPHPEQWPMLVEKSAELARTWKGIPPKKLQAIKASSLVFMADKDYVREEHGQELAKLLTGEFLVLPKSSHMSYIFKPNKLLKRLIPFLDLSITHNLDVMISNQSPGCSQIL